LIFKLFKSFLGQTPGSFPCPIPARRVWRWCWGSPAGSGAGPSAAWGIQRSGCKSHPTLLARVRLRDSGSSTCSSGSLKTTSVFIPFAGRLAEMSVACFELGWFGFLWYCSSGFAAVVFFFLHPVVRLHSGQLCRAVAELQPQPCRSWLRAQRDRAGASTAAPSAALPGARWRGTQLGLQPVRCRSRRVKGFFVVIVSFWLYIYLFLDWEGEARLVFLQAAGRPISGPFVLQPLPVLHWDNFQLGCHGFWTEPGALLVWVFCGPALLGLPWQQGALGWTWPLAVANLLTLLRYEQLWVHHALGTPQECCARWYFSFLS